MLWTNQPPESATGLGLPIRRTPAKGPFQAYILSEDLLGCPTHFVRNRTTPCTGENCPHCEEGYTWRWHGYLCILNPRTFAKEILEVTAQACETITEYRQAHGTLRGALIESWRPSARPNGRVRIKLAPADLRGRNLPPPADLKKVLCHLWNVSSNGAEVKPGPRQHPKIQISDPDPLRDEAFKTKPT